MDRLILPCAIVLFIAVGKAGIQTNGTLVLGYLLVVSITTIIANWVDKRNAQKGLWRVPEKYLHLLELFGGWPAAYLAQYKLHHKTRKQSYRLIFGLIVALHLCISVDYLLNWPVYQWIRSLL